MSKEISRFHFNYIGPFLEEAPDGEWVRVADLEAMWQSRREKARAATVELKKTYSPELQEFIFECFMDHAVDDHDMWPFLASFGLGVKTALEKSATTSHVDESEQFPEALVRDHFHRKHPKCMRDSSPVNHDVECARWMWNRLRGKS